jgi:hypothetical protein
LRADAVLRGTAFSFALLLGGCAAAPADALRCEVTPRAPRDAERAGRLERELAALPDTPATAAQRLALLDRLAGLGEEFDEYDFAPEAALERSIALREREGRTGERAYAQSLWRRGVLQWAHNRPASAEATLGRCLAAARPQSLESASCQLWLGILYNQTGRYA